MKKTWFAAVLALGLSAWTQAAVQTLKYASFLPATTSNNAVTMPKVKAKLEQLSNATLSLALYTGGTLGAGAKTQMRLVSNGVADIAEIPVAYTPGRVSGIDVFELPNLSHNNSDASLETMKLIESGKIGGLNRFVVLGALQAGPYLIHSKTPINSLADLQGKRIRVTGAIQSEMAKALGAVPVANIPANQIAENLSRNLIDATFADMGNVYNFGIADEAKYHVSNIYLGSFAVLFLMNKQRYDSLDAVQKAAVDAVRGQWFTKAVGADMDAQTERVLKRLAADPSQHIQALSEQEVAQAKQKLQAVVDDWIKHSASHAALYQTVSGAQQ